MDTIDLTQTNDVQPVKLELTLNSIDSLKQIRKWTMFFSILGFVFTGLIIAGIVFFITMIKTNTIFSEKFGHNFQFIGIFIMYILMAVLYFFPILYLYKFSAISKKAFSNSNSLELESAFKNLKFHFNFVGIMTIVFLAVYTIFIIIAIIFATSLFKI